MGAFDDLIPAKKGGGAFDDLVPQAAAPAPDVYHQAAADTYEKQKAAGLTGGQTEGLANRVLRGATMGFGDSILAGLETPIEMVTRGVGPSEGYKYAKAFQDVKGEHAKEDTGALGTAAEVVSSLAPGGAIAGGIGKVVSKPFLQSVGTGAAMGAAQAAGDDQDIAQGAAVGTVGGVLGGAAGKVLGGVTRKLTGGASEPVPVQSPDQIKAQAQNLYKRFEESGGSMTQQGAVDLHNAISKTMTDAGVRPGFSPKFDTVLNELNKLAPSNGAPALSTTDIQGLRQTASLIAQSIDPAERRIGHQLVGTIDDFISGASPEQFSGGMGAQHAAGLLKDANQNWQRYSKADMVDRALARAQQQAERTGSGGNIQNTIRQKVGGLADKRSWTPDERAQLELISRGTRTQNALRLAGKMAPQGGGLMQALNVGAMSYNPLMAIPAAAGAGAKFAADRMGRSQVQKLQQIISNGGTPSTVEVTPSAIEMWLRRSPAALLQGVIGAGSEE